MRTSLSFSNVLGVSSCTKPKLHFSSSQLWERTADRPVDSGSERPGSVGWLGRNPTVSSVSRRWNDLHSKCEFYSVKELHVRTGRNLARLPRIRAHYFQRNLLVKVRLNHRRQRPSDGFYGRQTLRDGNMNTPSNINITVFCPSGHRLRGGRELMGRRVICPKCQTQFDFAPEPTEPRPSAAPARRTVSESGVMAILGDMQQSPPPPRQQPPSTRPCPACSGAVNDGLPVCPHCGTYIGAMPTFMRQLRDRG